MTHSAFPIVVVLTHLLYAAPDDRPASAADTNTAMQADAEHAARTNDSTDEAPREEGFGALPSFGAFVPERGFTVANTDIGELTIGAYVLIRYLNQTPLEPTFTDHLGRQRPLNPRHDINVHRVLLYFSGWFADPKLRYGATIWTSNSTTHVAVIGYIGYVFSDAFQLFAGVGALPGTNTLRYIFPYWLGTDRRMADELFRPSFTSGVWATGEPLPGLHYTAMIGSALSQLGIDANQLDRDFAYSLSVWLEPTTGEYGPRGAPGDFEIHKRVATRVGASFTTSREDSFSQPDASSPENAQIRLADGVILFEEGALAPGVTVENALYTMAAVDAGIKYAGFAFNSEVFLRWISDFVADGPLPHDDLFNAGFTLQASYILLPRLLEVYTAVSAVGGELGLGRELAAGLNLRPFGTRNIRFNGEVIYLDRSSAGGLFTPYLPGMTGPVAHASVDLFF